MTSTEKTAFIKFVQACTSFSSVHDLKPAIESIRKVDAKLAALWTASATADSALREYCVAKVADMHWGK